MLAPTKSMLAADFSDSERMLTDFLGFQIPRRVYCNRAYADAEVHAIRSRVCALDLSAVRGTVQMAWPVVAEEYFEYADVLSSVLSYCEEQLKDKSDERCRRPGAVQGPLNVTRPFSFVELGAGYGHWTFAAHMALRQKLPKVALAADHGTRPDYLLVDVVDSLAPFVKELALLNRAQPVSVHFHYGFVAGRGPPQSVIKRINLTLDEAVSAQYHCSLPLTLTCADITCRSPSSPRCSPPGCMCAGSRVLPPSMGSRDRAANGEGEASRLRWGDAGDVVSDDVCRDPRESSDTVHN